MTWDQLRAISACLSYLHMLSTGNDGTNWKEVKQIWESLQYKDNDDENESIANGKVLVFVRGG